MPSKRLPVPHAAENDPTAVELIRVWAAQGEQHVALATNLWADPASWGIMLVDLAKHVASAYDQTTGKDYRATLQRIREGFDAEWGTATDEPIGGLQE